MQNTAKVIEMADWTKAKVKAPRLPHNFEAALNKVRPMVYGWMKAEALFESNTKAVATAVYQAYELYKKESGTGTRVDFARHFDTTIPADAKTRDVEDNPTYNKLNYLIDKIGKPAANPPADPETPRLTVEEKRKAMRADWMSFRRRFANKPIELDAVSELLANILKEIWTEEAVKEVVA